MALKYIGSLALDILCPDLFAAFGSVAIDFALQASGFVQLEASIGFTFIIPDIVGQIVIAAELAAAFELAIGLTLPNFNLELSLAIGVKLAIVEGILALLSPLAALASAGLEVYGYGGPGAGLGAAVTTSLAQGWPDGTSADESVVALVFGATSSGTIPVSQVRSVALLPPAPAPPAPPPPPALPTPSYEHGMASCTLSAPPPGGTQALASITVDNSVSTGIGAVTAVTLLDGGSGYTSPPSVTISDTVVPVAITGPGVPIVITLPNPLLIPIGQGFGVMIAQVQGNTAANGNCSAKVLTPTTIELYGAPVIGPAPTYTVGPSFVTPLVGNGTWTPGTGLVTGSGHGAAASATMGGGSSAALQGFFSGAGLPASGLEFQGSITLGAVCGGTFDLLLELVASLELQAGQLELQVKAALTLPTLTGSIALLLQIEATLKAALAAIPPMPSISLAFAASIAAQLKVIANLAAQVAFQLGLIGAGVELEVYSYEGPGDGFGPALTTALGPGWGNGTPPSNDVQVLILGATSEASATALSIFFAGAAA